MPSYFRFGIGPFRFSQRLGRTQAQKRAAARERAAQAKRRQEYREWKVDPRAQASHRQAVAEVAIGSGLPAARVRAARPWPSSS
jgi:hypothetical protein